MRAAFALRFLAGSVAVPHDAVGMRATIAALRDAFASDALVAGLAAEPAFPGACGGIERVGERDRLICACRLSAGGDELGVAITVIVCDRSVDVTLAPPSTPIDPAWTDVGSV